MSSAHNLSVDDCLSVAGVVKADTIIEQTADAGVTIEGVLLKDGAVSDTASSFIERSVLLYAQPTSVDARVLWDMAVNSDGADMSISVANDIVTILREGMYSITASVVFDTQAGGIRRIRVNKNGTTAADGIGESVVGHEAARALVFADSHLTLLQAGL